MITDSFDSKTEPIISLEMVYGEKKHLTDSCIITYSQVIYKTVLSSYPCEQIACVRAVSGDIPIYAFPHAGRKIAFYLSPIGATCAAQCLLEANWLTGAEKYIVFGSAGSLDAEKTANHFVIPTEAYRDEGMSYHYAPPSDYITVRNSETIKSIFDDLRVPCVTGKTWTTDAILRETRGQMASRAAEGCIAVEMEIAGLQAVCDFHGLGLYPFLVTGDVLSEDGYSLGTLADANHNVDKFRLALEIAGRI